MQPESPGSPSFDNLLARGQEVLTQLAVLNKGMAEELARQQAELAKHLAELNRQRPLLQELENLRGARQQWLAERERLAADVERLGKEHQALANQRAQLEQELKKSRLDLIEAKKAHEERLAGLLEEGDQLKQLHAHVTEQATKLGAEWNTRRQGLAAESQRLAAELVQANRTLDQSRQREKQWKDQLWKLQDEVRTLRGEAGRVALSAEQSHDVYSQLNAIIGFSEVLLDEGANRATGAEQQEFLMLIRDSGAHLAEYLKQLMTTPNDENAALQPSDNQPPVEPPRPDAPAVLVAATDTEMRQRIEPFLNQAGYRVEFAGDTNEAVTIALRLQPLAIMIDAELPPKGPQDLADQLLHEARTRDIPIVLIARNEDEQLGLSIGRYDFLRKPVSKQQVLHVMAKYDLLADRRRASKMPTSVLVIDDDAKNTRLVQAMLKPFSVEVLVAHSGNAGIKLARQRRPDLIILDLMMPDGDGFEVASALREQTTTSEIPVLIYTAKNLTGADRERLQGNIQSIIRKGQLPKEQFLELVYRRGERRKNRPAAEEAA